MSGFQELVDEINSLKHTNELLRDDFCRKEKKWEKENKELKEQIDDLQNTILHLESEKDDVENDVKNLNRDRIKQVRELCKENKELKEEIKTLNISLAGAREVRKRLDYAIEKLTKKNNDLEDWQDIHLRTIHYYKCFVNTADPDGNMMNDMKREDIEKYTQDSELRKYLYSAYHLDE